MRRICVSLAIICAPATAWADVNPEPRPFLGTNGWLVVASVALGLILAGFVVMKRRSPSDDEGPE